MASRETRREKRLAILLGDSVPFFQEVLSCHIPERHACLDPVLLCCSGETVTRLLQPRSSALCGQWRCTSNSWRLSISSALTVSSCP